MRYTFFSFLLIFISALTFGQQASLVTPLDSPLIETSGLILLDNRLITHNDSAGESALYEIDSLTGSISRTVIIENAPNIDWEDLCYDDTYIYIADFGNNSGNRTNLRVYRVLISDYLTTPNDTIVADTILFDYADQTDFTSSSFSTNYDAEAIISWNDSLYIFTKNWGNMWTNVYALPKTPGNYSLPRIDSINVEGFVTGASFNTSSNSIMLSCYAYTYPFVVEISNFTSSQFSSFTVDRSQIQLPSGYSYQLEGVTQVSATNYYISTEESFSGASGLFRFETENANAITDPDDIKFLMYPNPATHQLNVEHGLDYTVELYTMSGKFMSATSSDIIDVSDYPCGTYVVVLKNKSGSFIGQGTAVIE